MIDGWLTGQTKQSNPEKRTMLPKMAFSGFVSRYREPKLEEGFQDITKVDFKVSRAPVSDVRGRERYPDSAV